MDIRTINWIILNIQGLAGGAFCFLCVFPEQKRAECVGENSDRTWEVEGLNLTGWSTPIPHAEHRRGGCVDLTWQNHRGKLETEKVRYETTCPLSLEQHFLWTQWPKYETYIFDIWCPLLSTIGTENIKHPIVHAWLFFRGITKLLARCSKVKECLRVYILWSQERSFFKNILTTTTTKIYHTRTHRWIKSLKYELW